MAHFNDGDLHYLVTDSNMEMIIIHRTAEELFSKTIRRICGPLNLAAAINGNVYDVTASGMMDAFAGHDSVPAKETIPIGLCVESGKVIAGKSEPARFHVSVQCPINTAPSSACYTFGQGDPPTRGSGLGGLGPLIVARLSFGIGNHYAAGTPPGAPATGKPGAVHSPFLLQRNNNTYAAMAARGKGVGKMILAVNRTENMLLLLAQPHYPATSAGGMHLDEIRDRLARAGVDDAVFMDGSDSAILWMRGMFLISQGEDKDELTTIGLGFR